MANRQRGEVEFALDGKAYFLRLGTNEMCSLEAAFDTDIQSVFARLDGDNLRMSDMRLILAAMMGETNLNAVGAIIDQLGFDKVGELLGQAVELAFPEVEPGAGKPQATVKK